VVTLTCRSWYLRKLEPLRKNVFTPYALAPYLANQVQGGSEGKRMRTGETVERAVSSLSLTAYLLTIHQLTQPLTMQASTRSKDVRTVNDRSEAEVWSAGPSTGKKRAVGDGSKGGDVAANLIRPLQGEQYIYHRSYNL
jgi:hypothetical protein